VSTPGHLPARFDPPPLPSWGQSPATVSNYHDGAAFFAPRNLLDTPHIPKHPQKQPSDWSTPDHGPSLRAEGTGVEPATQEEAKKGEQEASSRKVVSYG